jgi:hypothetical protein
MKPERRTRISGIEPISELLAPTLKRMGVHGAVRDVQIGDIFAEVVGVALAPHCRALRVEHGALVVACVNPALAQQLHLEKIRIISQVNLRLGGEAIKRLRFASS